MRSTLTLLALAARAFCDPVGPTLPWGIHTTLGLDPLTTRTIMWSTRSPVSPSIVTFTAAGGAPQTAQGEELPFSNSGNMQTIHRVRLAGLAPGTAYSYTVGDGRGNTSGAFSFVTPPSQGWSPGFAIYGDMGITSNALDTMPLLLADAQAGLIDGVVHLGDLAYDLQSNNGATGDSFMEMIQPLAANLPYMTCPGNR